MIRRVLDQLFRLSEAAGALIVFLIFIVILAQVLLSAISRLLGGIGVASFDLLVPAYAEISAYLLAAAMFLALAGTLKSGVHVRVSLVLQNVPPRLRQAMEVLGGAIGFLVSGYFAWRALLLAYGSWVYGDLSYGMIIIPMWLPQMPMALGLIILAIAFLDYSVRQFRQRPMPAVPGDTQD